MGTRRTKDLDEYIRQKTLRLWTLLKRLVFKEVTARVVSKRIIGLSALKILVTGVS